MRIYCTQCGRPVLPEDMNLDTLVAKCRGCHSIFGFADDFQDIEQQIVHKERRWPRPIIPHPPRVTVEERASELRLIRSWFSCELFLLLLFCITWDTFLVCWYSNALKNWNWSAILFPVCHVAVGIGLTYTTLAGFVNQTVMSVAADRLCVRHGPVPWVGERDLDATAIDQLYCKERTRTRRGNVSIYYDVHAMMKDGSDVRLLSGLEDDTTALFIEQTVEERLGIPDREIRGELRR